MDIGGQSECNVKNVERISFDVVRDTIHPWEGGGGGENGEFSLLIQWPKWHGKAIKEDQSGNWRQIHERPPRNTQSTNSEGVEGALKDAGLACPPRDDGGDGLQQEQQQSPLLHIILKN